MAPLRANNGFQGRVFLLKSRMNKHAEPEDIVKTRKRLTFRSWHRGTREMDLILGRFADSYLGDFTAEQLTQYETLLGYSDPDLYNWITGREEVPANLMSPVLELLVAFDVSAMARP